MKKLLLVLVIGLISTGVFAQDAKEVGEVRFDAPPMGMDDIPWGASVEEVKAREAKYTSVAPSFDSKDRIQYATSFHVATWDLSSLPEPYDLLIFRDVIYLFIEDKLVRVMIVYDYDAIGFMEPYLIDEFNSALELYSGTNDADHNPDNFIISRNEGHIFGFVKFIQDNAFMQLFIVLTDPNLDVVEVEAALY